MDGTEKERIRGVVEDEGGEMVKEPQGYEVVCARQTWLLHLLLNVFSPRALGKNPSSTSCLLNNNMFRNYE